MLPLNPGVYFLALITQEIYIRLQKLAQINFHKTYSLRIYYLKYLFYLTIKC